jgi:hypothetical protein
MAKYKLSLFIALFSFLSSFGQLTPMTAFQYGFKRIVVDSTLQIPSFCGVPTLRNSTVKNGALAMDTCANKLYKYTRAAGWSEVSGGGGGSQDLQSVTDEGNTTNNQMIVGDGTDSLIIAKDAITLFSGTFGGYGSVISALVNSWTYSSNSTSLAPILNGQHNFYLYNSDTSTLTTDTLATLANVRASVAGSGTVTSVATGYGLSGGTITTSGTLLVDSATLSSKYLRIVDTTNKWVNNITRTLGKDSIIYYIGNTRYAIKDSVGTNPPASGYYGAFQDNNTQTAAVSNVGYPMKLRINDLTNGITITGSDTSRITFANTGIYNLQFSSQFQNTDNAQHDITIWLRLNGTDVAGSAGYISIPARKSAGAGNEGHGVYGWNYVLSVVAGQYYQIVWSTSNATNVTMQFYAAGSPPPSTASVIATVTQQAGILAGTGITALGTSGNEQTGAVQTLATGTSGTDFTISSSSNIQTFNLPTASATNRGALSSANWSTFNSKIGPGDTAIMLTKYLRKTDTATLSSRINLKVNISDTASMLTNYVKKDTACLYLISDATTSNTTATNTNLTFPIAANETYRIMIAGTCSKATTTTGMKIAIAAPTGCSIKSVIQGGQALMVTAPQGQLYSSVNTLCTNPFATGAGVEVPFRLEGVITNGANAGSITLQFATVTSNTATIYAGTVMQLIKSKGL